MDQLIFTQPLQIQAVSGENKKINTKYGEKETFSFKDSSGEWYTSWQTDKKGQILDWSRNGDMVVIGYETREYNGKTYRTAKQVSAVEGNTPKGSNSPQNGSDSTKDKDEDIRRAVALKAAVELVCAGKNDGRSCEDIAEGMLAWLKGEEKKPLQTNADELNIEEIPF